MGEHRKGWVMKGLLTGDPLVQPPALCPCPFSPAAGFIGPLQEAVSSCLNWKLIPMTEKAQPPWVTNFTLWGFKTRNQDSQWRVNQLKKCLETEGSAHPVNNDVVP